MRMSFSGLPLIINFVTGKKRTRDILMVFTERIYTGVIGVIFKRAH